MPRLWTIRIAVHFLWVWLTYAIWIYVSHIMHWLHSYVYTKTRNWTYCASWIANLYCLTNLMFPHLDIFTKEKITVGHGVKILWKYQHCILVYIEWRFHAFKYLSWEAVEHNNTFKYIGHSNRCGHWYEWSVGQSKQCPSLLP